MESITILRKRNSKVETVNWMFFLHCSSVRQDKIDVLPSKHEQLTSSKYYMYADLRDFKIHNTVHVPVYLGNCECISCLHLE